MKAITILQPWASLIACGAKKIETRSWATKYRGPIAIHAGKAWTMYMREFTYRDPFHSALWPNMTKEELMLNGYGRTRLLPLGSVIAIADLVDCEEMTIDKIVLWRDVYGKNEISFGDFIPGRYAWILANVQRIEPIPARGMQRIWNWDACLRYVEWPIGTKVKMVNCYESEENKNIIWETKSKPWLLGCGEQLVNLVGYSGGFATGCLEVVQL